MSKKPLISLVVVGYYRDQNFLRCIRALINQIQINFEIILIWSQIGDFNVKKYLIENIIDTSKIHIHEYEENLGFAKGYNVGVDHANGEYVIIINPDVDITSHFTMDLLKVYKFLIQKKRTEDIIVGPRICNPSGVLEFSRRKINFLGFSNPDYSQTNKIRRTMITSGCCFLIKKEKFQELNGFDEEYFMYHEDIDFSIRASMIGMKQYVDNSIRLLHLKDDEGYKLGRFKYFYHERNRLMMCLEHSQRKGRMVLVQLLFEPFHIVFALMKGFLGERLKIYAYLLKNLRRIMTSKRKQNNLFDRYSSIEGIFNEVDSDSLTFKFLNVYSKILFYLYHS
ncbi:glycosyltransferase family 2 protein [Candidatus Lokiarchaeum ossiferum]|uniref:glycosyltransferase family 2 protein n=1 Tax=Candidatus Lokiarchaeum ossiferum TaxID=2951803 RepID=UPI00352EC0F3